MPNANLGPEEMSLLYNAGTIPSALMAAALQRAGFSLPHLRQVPRRQATVVNTETKQEVVHILN